MLVISQAGKVNDVLGITQPPRRLWVIAKAQDFIRVGNVYIIIVEGNPKR